MLTQRIPAVPDAASPGRASRTPAARYRRSLWLLTTRDLKVRYSTSALGWFWSILDPLVMSGIYWFVFTVVFSRDVGEEPYIVFLLAALLPWMWFTGATSDFTRAFSSQAKLVRSTRIPRSIWVLRLVLAKGFEFVASLPVLAVFAIVAGARLDVHVLLFPLAVLIQAALLLGIGLIVSPLVVFFRDLERAVKLVLRFLFYASPSSTRRATCPPSCIPGLRSIPSPASSASTAPRSSPPSSTGTRSGSARRSPPAWSWSARWSSAAPCPPS